MSARILKFVLTASILWLSWLMMMLVHESGHVLGAVCSGGTVRRVVWHPAVISRTDVQPNPHPLVEVWAGPLVGSVVPVLIAVLSALLRCRITYLLWGIAGFCLIANGAYIGIGSIQPIGDAGELIADGMPRWTLAAFGGVAAAGGLWIWHRVSPRFGFGGSPIPIRPHDAWGTFVIAVLVTTLGFFIGNRGV